jgi:predicted HTH transcriptional regulator
MCSFQDWNPYADHFCEDKNHLQTSLHSEYSFLNRVICTAVTMVRRQGTITPQQLAERWRIGIDTAKQMIKNTMQLAVWDFTHMTGGRQLKPIHYQLKSRRLSTQMYTDTMISPTC